MSSERRLCAQLLSCKFLQVILQEVVDLMSAFREQPGETKDLDTDPTLQRSDIECPACHHHGYVTPFNADPIPLSCTAANCQSVVLFSIKIKVVVSQQI